MAEKVSLGIETDEGVVDIFSTALELGLYASRDMGECLQRALGKANTYVMDEAAQSPEFAVLLDATEVQFAPLVNLPQKVIHIGCNHRKYTE